MPRQAEINGRKRDDRDDQADSRERKHDITHDLPPARRIALDWPCRGLNVGTRDANRANDTSNDREHGQRESLAILDSHKRLFQIHLNENYRDADPDLIIGTLAFWDNLEFFYYLVKSDYEGTIELDYQTPREEQKKSLNLAVKMVYKYKEMAEKLLKHEKEIEKNLLGYHFTDNMELITDLIF